MPRKPCHPLYSRHCSFHISLRCMFCTQNCMIHIYPWYLADNHLLSCTGHHHIYFRPNPGCTTCNLSHKTHILRLSYGFFLGTPGILCPRNVSNHNLCSVSSPFPRYLSLGGKTDIQSFLCLPDICQLRILHNETLGAHHTSGVSSNDPVCKICNPIHSYFLHP